MRLLSIRLEQFRNYPVLTQGFSDDELHLFVGKNGSGKTNLLEAVGLLSLTKSFLGVEEEDLPQWGTDFYRITARVKSDAGEEAELEVCGQMSPRRQKACFRNSVKIATKDMVGQLPIVAFLPQDLTLFSGPPAERRRFLDQILCQVSGEYLHHYLEYQRVLKQRNALLKGIAEGLSAPDALDAWDPFLLDHGAFLVRLRLELMETCNLSLPHDVQGFGETWKEVKMVYQSNTDDADAETTRGKLAEMLRARRERDILLQTTSVGPHRDDWTVLADGRPLFSFASRGQQRVVALALLLLQASYMEVRRNERAVILLDDIFSELDAFHRQRVLESLKDHQVLMTATDMPIPGEFTGSVHQVESGEITAA